MRPQIFEDNGVPPTDALIVSETSPSAKHLGLTALADGRLALASVFNNGRQVAYIDTRNNGIGLSWTTEDHAQPDSVYADSRSGSDGNDRLNGSDGNDSVAGG